MVAGVLIPVEPKIYQIPGPTVILSNVVCVADVVDVAGLVNPVVLTCSSSNNSSTVIYASRIVDVPASALN